MVVVVSVADGGLTAGRWVAVLVDWRIAVPDRFWWVACPRWWFRRGLVGLRRCS